MAKSIWKSKSIDQRRKALYDDYRAIIKDNPIKTNVLARLATKYGISIPTIYADIKAVEQANDSKRANRTASR